MRFCLMLCFLLLVSCFFALKLITFICALFVFELGIYTYLSYICIIQTERYFSKTN